MSTVILIGIDDTDILGSAGTGRMARDLADHLVSLSLGNPLGITRHQLLVDERIPYTSHNSSLCIALHSDNRLSEFFQPCIDFLRNNFREGSDPGLCICHPDNLDKEIIRFGLNAQEIVLLKKEAINLAEQYGLFLTELGGTGGGIIGALAAIALRAEGNSGRYVDLPGIRSITGTVTVSELLSRTDIDSVRTEDGTSLAANSLIDSRDWVRPSLVKNKPVLKVRRGISENRKIIWTSVEQREREKTGERN
jgi:hypothetical protein